MEGGGRGGGSSKTFCNKMASYASSRSRSSRVVSSKKMISCTRPVASSQSVLSYEFMDGMLSVVATTGSSLASAYSSSAFRDLQRESENQMIIIVAVL